MRVLFVALLIAASAAAQDVVLPDGKAKTMVQDACSDCHGLDRVVSSGMSADKWKTTVTRMVKKGAALSPEQIDQVVEYLSVYFAAEKINVNHATAQDLQIDMQFTSAEAEAIVAYRKANGDFKDFAGLQKVPGVDPKKLEAKREQFSF
jgi:competence protein ComEA